MTRHPLILLILLALAALAGCTSSGANDRDRDNDLADDELEAQGTTITIYFLEGPERRDVTSDPMRADTDEDGVLDGEEILVRGTDPRDVDTDDDRLLDGQAMLATGARADAFRRAGIIESNGSFLGELSTCLRDAPQLRPQTASSDFPTPDGLIDGEEIQGWTILVRGEARSVTSDPCKPDTDADGLADDEEKQFLTDPRLADTDGDGTPDGFDADPLWDLALRFEDAEVTRSNATSARILFAAGAQSAELRWPGNASALLQVNDQTIDRTKLDLRVVLRAERGDGAPLALFDDPRGAILTFDLLQRTASGATIEGDRLVFEGENGTLSLRWSVLRR